MLVNAVRPGVPRAASGWRCGFSFSRHGREADRLDAQLTLVLMARHRMEAGTAARSGRCRRVVSSEGPHRCHTGFAGPYRIGMAERLGSTARAGLPASSPNAEGERSQPPIPYFFDPWLDGGRLFRRPGSGPDHLPADRVGAEGVGRIPEPVLAAARVRREPLTFSRVRAGAMSTEVPERRGGTGSGSFVTVACQSLSNVSLMAVRVPVGRCRRFDATGNGVLRTVRPFLPCAETRGAR